MPPTESGYRRPWKLSVPWPAEPPMIQPPLKTTRVTPPVSARALCRPTVNSAIMATKVPCSSIEIRMAWISLVSVVATCSHRPGEGIIDYSHAFPDESQRAWAHHPVRDGCGSGERIARAPDALLG